jgi:hypothetical protein
MNACFPQVDALQYTSSLLEPSHIPISFSGMIAIRKYAMFEERTPKELI